MAVLLKDIADRAGVSVMTVSRALNNKSGVSEKKKKEILDIAKSFYYVPNLKASSLRKNNGKDEGVTVILPLAAGHTGNLLSKELKEQAYRQFDKTDFVLNYKWDIMETLKTLAGENIRNIIIHSRNPLKRESIELLKKREIKTVCAGYYCKDFDSVSICDEKAVFQTVKMLFLGGCERIVYYCWDIRDLPGSRIRGVKKACKVFEKNVEIKHFPFARNYYRQGYEEVRKLLASGCPDAICCTNDEVAIGALKAIYDCGLKVPDDIKITGYDNTPQSEFCIPPLTTSAYPADEVARSAVELMQRRIDQPEAEISTSIIQTQLFIRESAPAASKKIKEEIFRKPENK